MVAMPSSSAATGSGMVTGSPCHTISPPSGWYAPERILMSVDLPAPFWPSTQCTSPARTSRSTPLRALTPANDLVIAAHRQ